MRKIARILSVLLAGCLSLQMVSIPAAADTTVQDPLWQDFQNPPASSKTRPLWFWNNEIKDMTPEKIREIVRESYLQSGYNGFGILPNWLSEYLNDDYFALYEAALDEGSKYGMQFSLYDENGFPSYNAGGLLEEQYPDLTTKRIDKIEKEAKDGSKTILSLPVGTFLGAVAMNTETKERIDISDYATIVDPPPFDPATEPLGISASSTYSIDPGYEASKAADGDLTTRWNAGSMTGGGEYLQINFGEPKTFDSVKIYEDALPALHRTTAYSIQYWNAETASWEIADKGTTITDKGVTNTFTPVTSQLVRLFIKSVTQDSASISEFQVFNGEEQLAVPPSPLIPDEPGVSASSVYEMASGYEADKAFDGDMSTRWNAAAHGGAPQWLQMSFGEERTVDSAVIYEDLGRVSSFKIQYWNGSEWQNCASGTTIGSEGLRVSFDPVQTTKMRLFIDGINGVSPSIWELEFYDGAEKIQPNYGEEGIPEGSYLEYTVPEGNWKVMAFMCVKDGNNGMDYLDPASVRAFIDITYEAYYERFQKYFENGTITSAFYDEPTFWPWPGKTPYGAKDARLWTPNFNQEYADRFDGESPVLNYPALWYDIGDATDEARNKLQYVRTELFAESYLGQIQDWCTDHGISLMGHMLLEEWTNPVGLHGDLMKVFKNQDIPGVDVIGYYGYTQEAYKIISSSANNWDKGLVMSESFGAMGEGMNKNVLYKSSMDQYAKGVNMIIPHALWYDDTSGKVDYPPELSYRNPNFKDELPIYNNYMGRLNTLLQNGRHVADIAMLYPIDYLESSFIFNGQANNPADADYMRVGETLSLSARRDFTYLHPDIIDEKCSVEGDTFKMDNAVNYEQFKVFIMPGTQVISLSNLEKIKAFYDGGGKVIATTQLPTRATTDGDNQKVIDIIKEMFGVDPATGAALDGSTPEYTKQTNEQGGASYFIKSGFETKLQTVLDDALPVYDVVLENVPAISGGNLSYIHKVKDNRDIYFIANSSDTAVNTTVALRGELGKPVVWDPMTGEKYEPAYTVENGVTRVSLSLTAVQSLFILDETDVQAQVDKSALETLVQTWENTNLDNYLDGQAKDNFVTALADAKAVLNDADATQTQVDNAASALETAAGLLELKPQNADKTILNKVIAYAEARLTDGSFDQAIPSVQESFTAVLNEAKELSANSAATQAEVDQMWIALMGEIHKLGFIAGDKSVLSADYEIYSKLDLNNYVDNDAKQAFVEALNTAKQVLDDRDAMQPEIDAADSALVEAASKLIRKADKTQLNAAIEQANRILPDLEEKYVSAGQAEFKEALEKAEQIAQDDAALQEEIDRATEALIQALLNLRYKADKSILNTLVSAAQAIDTTQYTPQSVAQFNSALEQAKAKLADESISSDRQQEIDQAVQALSEAVNKLERKDGSSEKLLVAGDGTIQTGSSSAKTGEALPIAAAAALLLAGAALVVRKRK